MPVPRRMLQFCQQNKRRCQAIKITLALSAAVPAVAASSTAAILELTDEELDDELNQLVDETLDRMANFLNLTMEETKAVVEQEAENVFGMASLYSAGMNGLDRTNRANGRDILELQPLSTDPQEPEYISLVWDLAQDNSQAASYMKDTERFRQEHDLTYLDHSTSDSTPRKRRDVPTLDPEDLARFQAKLDAARAANKAALTSSADQPSTTTPATSMSTQMPTPAPPSNNKKELWFLQTWNRKLNTCENKLAQLTPLVHSQKFELESLEEAYKQLRNRLHTSEATKARMAASHVLEKDKMESAHATEKDNMASSLSSVNSKLVQAREIMASCAMKQLRPRWPRDLFISSASVAGTLLASIMAMTIWKLVRRCIREDPHRRHLLHEAEMNNRNAGQPRNLLGHGLPLTPPATPPPDQLDENPAANVEQPVGPIPEAEEHENGFVNVPFNA